MILTKIFVAKIWYGSELECTFNFLQSCLPYFPVYSKFHLSDINGPAHNGTKSVHWPKVKRLLKKLDEHVP